jgi:N-acetylglutamate synthase-like GNAT family acetyltransferase
VDDWTTLVVTEDPPDEDGRALLEAVGLPTADLGAHLPFVTITARKEDRVVGIAAVEIHGATAMLRSVAVDPEFRSQRVAAALTEAATIDASRRGAETMYLLTEDAAGYFSRHGFEETPRASAPVAIRNTRLFAELCPASAILMQKRLT